MKIFMNRLEIDRLNFFISLEIFKHIGQFFLNYWQVIF